MAKTSNSSVARIIKFIAKSEGTEETERKFNNLGKEIDSLKIRFASVTAAIKKITDETDKLAVNQRLLGTTFGKSVDSVTKYANALADMTGIAESDIYKQTALFGQTANSLGLAAETAELYSRNLTTLSSKLSMLYNIDFGSASKALRDAAKGESSTLATLTGIIVKNTTLKDELYRIGIDREISSLNNAESAILQYITVSRQMQNTDMATAQAVNSVAWQKQLLAEQVKRLATAIGKVLYPVLQAILPVFNAILMVITNIIEIFARLIGYKGDTVNTMQSISSGFDSIGNSASGAAKKMNTSLRSFDKLNNIKTPTDTTYSGGGGFGIDAGLLDEFGKMNQEMLNISNRATEIADKIMEWLGFAKDVNGEWEFSEVKLGTLVGILVGSGGILWAVSKVYDIIKSIKKIGGLIGASGGVSSLASLAKVIGGVSLIIFGILSTFQGIKELKMGDYFNGVLDIIIGIGAAVAGVAILLSNWPVAIIAGIVLVVAEIVKHWEEIKKFFKNVGKWVDDKIIQPIKDKFNTLPGWMKTLIRGIANTAITVINGLITGLNAMLAPLRAIIVVIGKVMGKNWTLQTISIPKIPKFAEGGFPEDGLFMANHNELVGKFSNGKTAVANNEDISKGIEQASFQGMMKALMATGGSKQKVEITAEGDASGLLDFITFKQKQTNRRNGL